VNVKNRAQTGFTLIEILVVVVIIGIIAGLIVPNVIGRDEQAKVAAARNDIRAIANALEMYRLDNNHYPSTEQGLEALASRPSGFPEPRNYNEQGYLRRVPVDPVGQRVHLHQ
jgi:general secretion pathway protein G